MLKLHSVLSGSAFTALVLHGSSVTFCMVPEGSFARPMAVFTVQFGSVILGSVEFLIWSLWCIFVL